jgi:F-type H+-transporting ATPase subunit b
VKTSARLLLFVAALCALLATAAAPASAQQEGPRGDTHGAQAAGDEHGPTGHGAGHTGPGGEHHFNGKAYAFQALNFAILLVILLKFGGGAINKMLAARHEQLKADLADASRARLAAEERLKQQEKRLANLEQELTGLRAALKHEAEHEKAQLLAVAEERVRRIQSETSFLLEQQVKEAERRFRDEVATAALKIAEEQVRRSLQPDDEQRFVQTFVGELERGTPAAPRRTL